MRITSIVCLFSLLAFATACGSAYAPAEAHTRQRRKGKRLPALRGSCLKPRRFRISKRP